MPAAMGNSRTAESGPTAPGASAPAVMAAAFDRAFCARVRAARIACGISRADMARRLGISRSTYARYEAGAPLLPLHLVGEFAEITGADLEELLAAPEICATIAAAGD